MPLTIPDHWVAALDDVLDNFFRTVHSHGEFPPPPLIQLAVALRVERLGPGMLDPLRIITPHETHDIDSQTPSTTSTRPLSTSAALCTSTTIPTTPLNVYEPDVIPLINDVHEIHLIGIINAPNNNIHADANTNLIVNNTIVKLIVSVVKATSLHTNVELNRTKINNVHAFNQIVNVVA
ncbi:hypothetical protein H0H93_012689 [Arthromyces matolae]|nr:hypothetical protein H0H93_012689 [Arthromyces matolae]